MTSEGDDASSVGAARGQEPAGRSDLRRLKLVLEYDGTEFSGWQRQSGQRTVQGELERALERILRQPHPVTGAGRTDAGVHARGQVSHLDTHHRLSAEALLRSLNAVLPRDLAVLRIEPVPPTFHARHSHHLKCYVYQIWNAPERSVFLERYAWHERRPLELDAMREGALALVGRHDFSAFRAADCGAAQPIRQIVGLEILERRPGLVCIEVEGNGFLKQMVRNIVGTLVEVGLGRREPQEVWRILESRSRAQAGKTAPAKGLWLERVDYDRQLPVAQESLRAASPLPSG